MDSDLRQNMFRHYDARAPEYEEAIESIELDDVTQDLARESGFASVEDLFQTARHGRGDNVYLVRFHYLTPGGWDDLPQGGRPVERASGRRA